MSNQGDGEQEEEWTHITDPVEKRRIQNKNAQRRFRAKAKEKEEDQKRETQNRERASSAYTPPEQLDDRSDLSGLPWGGLSLAYMAQSSKAKESTSQAETSGETTTAATSSEKP